LIFQYLEKPIKAIGKAKEIEPRFGGVYYFRYVSSEKFDIRLCPFRVFLKPFWFFLNQLLTDL